MYISDEAHKTRMGITSPHLHAAVLGVPGSLQGPGLSLYTALQAPHKQASHEDHILQPAGLFRCSTNHLMHRSQPSAISSCLRPTIEPHLHAAVLGVLGSLQGPELGLHAALQAPHEQRLVVVQRAGQEAQEHVQAVAHAGAGQAGVVHGRAAQVVQLPRREVPAGGTSRSGRAACG